MSALTADALRVRQTVVRRAVLQVSQLSVRHVTATVWLHLATSAATAPAQDAIGSTPAG